MMCTHIYALSVHILHLYTCNSIKTILCVCFIVNACNFLLNSFNTTEVLCFYVRGSRAEGLCSQQPGRSRDPNLPPPALPNAFTLAPYTPQLEKQGQHSAWFKTKNRNTQETPTTHKQTIKPPHTPTKQPTMKLWRVNTAILKTSEAYSSCQAAMKTHKKLSCKIFCINFSLLFLKTPLNL